MLGFAVRMLHKENIDETISDFLLFKESSEEIINRNRDDLQKL